MKTHPILGTTILALLCAATTASANITLETVTVGNPGNLNDTVVAGDGSGRHFGGG